MKIIRILLIIGIMILIMMNSCSLLIDGYTRNVGYNSICWEDDNHILMYSMVRKWVNTSAISWGSETGDWAWSKGEIWRINVFTGEKELLLRREGDKYTGLSTVIKIDVLGDRKLISLDGNAYIMEGESTDWQEIEGIYEAEWINDNEIIGIKGENGNIVKYHIETNTEEIVLNADMKAKYFTYDKINQINFISRWTSLVTKKGINDSIKITFLDTFEYNDLEIMDLDYCKIKLINNMNITVNISADNDNKRKSYLLVLDKELTIVDLIEPIDNIVELDAKYINGRVDLEIFLSYIYGDEKIIVFNKNKNIITNIYFPLDQLDE